MDDGALRGEQRALRPGDTDPLGCLLRVEQLVVVAQPQFHQLLVLVLDTRPLVGAARDQELPALAILRVDTLGGGDAADLVDRVVERQVDGTRGVRAEARREHARANRELRRTPAAVAPRRAEPGDLALDHDHAERRVLTEQIVGRPQAREPRAEDRDVHVDGTRERRARGQVVGRSLEPETVGPVIFHAPPIIDCDVDVDV